MIFGKSGSGTGQHYRSGQNVAVDGSSILWQSADRRFYQNQLMQALHIYACISPVRSLKALRQGDVIVSRSGNFRLLLQITESDSDALLSFLTMLPDRRLRLEAALRSRVDVNRLYAVVVRRNTNPIGNFCDLAEGLAAYESLFYNIATLLFSTTVGEELRRHLSLGEAVDGDLITLYISSMEGTIVAVDRATSSSALLPIQVCFNGAGSPLSEYISRISISSSLPHHFKRHLVAATVFANTLQNAYNLVESVKKAEAEK